VGQIRAPKWAKSGLSRAFGANKVFCYSFLMNTASLFADPNLLQLESEAMINTDDAPSQRSADATAHFAPKARENLDLAHPNI
jgi:hypothetical protein